MRRASGRALIMPKAAGWERASGGSTIEAVNASMENEVKKWAEVIAKAGIAQQ